MGNLCSAPWGHCVVVHALVPGPALCFASKNNRPFSELGHWVRGPRRTFEGSDGAAEAIFGI